MTTIFDLFAKSPFGYLQKHMHAAQRCFELVPDLFMALKKGDYKKLEALKDQINELEHAADKITKTVRSELHGGRLMLLAVPPEDLLALTKAIDDIADASQDIAVSVTLRQLSLPKELVPSLDELVARVLRACRLAASAVEGIDELLATSFAKSEIDKIVCLVNETKLAEHEADVAGIAASQKMYSLEKELGAVAVFRFAEVIKELGTLADASEELAKKIFVVLVKHFKKRT